MKNIFTIAVLLIALTGNAQKLIHHVSLGFSNNGQISDEMNRFYFSQFQSPTADNYHSLALKGNLTYSITTHNFEFGIIAGYGQRADRFAQHHSEKTHASQQYASAMPFALKIWKFKAVHLSAGAGIPCYAISHYDVSGKNDSGSSFDMRMTGGNSIGISGLVQLKWNLTERFSINGLMNFGVLHMAYGKDYALRSYDANGNLTGMAYSTAYKQQKTIIPSPELSLAIGFRL